MNDRPQNIQEYKKWLKDKHNIVISNTTKDRYISVSYLIKEDFEKSDFWIQLINELSLYDQEYLKEKKYRLLIPNFSPKLDIKTFDSFLLKTFRKNILENKKWPDPPIDDWCFPDNWFIKINDIIRTKFIVKYLDGVDYLFEKIEELSVKYDKEIKKYYSARWEGYYALHSYIFDEFEISKPTPGTERIKIPIEIQITTQIQDVIYQLLHNYYEEKRKRLKKKDEKIWQWDYESPDFVANYLGHILHYVEGMIMEVREKQKEKTE